jgi:hypothetical protein
LSVFINISDCLKSPGTCDSSPCITTCKIKTDKNNTCKTYGMLISNLTGKTYYTKSFDPLDCSTKNVIYAIGTVRCTKHRTVCMMVNLLDDSNCHLQTVTMTRLIEMIIQNPVFGISCIISMLAHSTS